jgi:hypothetical protein
LTASLEYCIIGAILTLRFGAFLSNRKIVARICSGSQKRLDKFVRALYNRRGASDANRRRTTTGAPAPICQPDAEKRLDQLYESWSHVFEAHVEIIVDLLLAPPRQKFKKVKAFLSFFRFFLKNKKIRNFAFLRIFGFKRVPRGTLGRLLNENGSHLEVGTIIA